MVYYRIHVQILVHQNANMNSITCVLDGATSFCFDSLYTVKGPKITLDEGQIILSIFWLLTILFFFSLSSPHFTSRIYL